MINFTNTQFEQNLINRFNVNGYIANNRDEAKMIILSEAKLECNDQGYIDNGTLIQSVGVSACLLGSVLQELVKSGDLVEHPTMSGFYKLGTL